LDLLTQTTAENRRLAINTLTDLSSSNSFGQIVVYKIFFDSPISLCVLRCS